MRLTAAPRLTLAAAVSLLPLVLPAAPGAALAAGDAEAAFARGLELFEEARTYAREHPAERDEIASRYRRAAESFVDAWEKGGASAETFTNAANSFYFAGDTGEAVLFYRRALAVEPAAERAREALQHIRAGLPIRKAAGGAAASLLRTLFFWHESLSFRLRRLLFSIGFPAAFALFAISLWRRRPFRALGYAALAASVVILGSLLVDAFAGSIRDDAVMMVEVQGRRGDGLSYSPSHSRPFPPGTEAMILETRAPASAGTGATETAGWTRLRLLDGSESWVPAASVERILTPGL